MDEREKAFYKKLEELNVYNNETFDFQEHNLLIEKIHYAGIVFNYCVFNCQNIIFKNIQKEIGIVFNNCTFNCDVNFENCSLTKLLFNDTISIKSLNINPKYDQHGIFDTFKFSNFPNSDKTELNTDFSINNITVNKFFFFEHIHHVSGKLHFYNNIFGIEENEHGNTIFNNSTISNIFFKKNRFNNLTTFLNSTIKYDYDELQSASEVYKSNKFYNNTFEKVKFDNSKFIGKCEFDKCDFLDTTWFEECNNIHDSELIFIACKFDKYSLFDKSKFNKIEILRSKFLDKASFENFEANSFKIHQVTFTEAAYFDDLNKNNNLVIEKWDRKTIRAIKRELVNTHNQIDYLRFKAYELNAYKKEKGKNWKDSFILFFNNHSNYFGLDWTKGLFFTTIIGFLFYLLYLCTYAIVMKNTLYFPNTIEDFFVGYLKFLNPFSLFKSPIENAETYFFPLLSFMIGKIFISYGIVQTVQAFRKFGLNGG